MIARGVVILILTYFLSMVFGGVTFTGSAMMDFRPTSFTTEEFRDYWHISDSSLVSSAGAGFDILGVYLWYDKTNDRLYVGVECNGICGDADGDGKSGFTSNRLVSDQAHYCAEEHFGLMMWPNPPANWTPRQKQPDWFFPTLVAGVGHGACLEDAAVFRLKYPTCAWPIPPNSMCAVHQRSLLATYGHNLETEHPVGTVEIPYSPSADKPSLEFSIPNFSKLPGFDGTITSVALRFQTGSPMDAVGEDYAPNNGVSVWRFA